MANQDKIETEAETCVAEGMRLIRASRFRQALAVFDRALEMKAGYGEAFFGRGICRYKLGQYPSAAADLDAATLLGCETAQLWSRFDLNHYNDDEA